MRKNILIISFLVSSVLASWTNKVSDRLLNPQNYFKKQKLKMPKDSIPKDSIPKVEGRRQWFGGTDNLEGELECVIYTTNEGKYIILTDDEYNNMPESPYKGLYRRYKIIKTINENNFLNKLPLYAGQSLVDYFKGNPIELTKEYKEDFFKFTKGRSIVSIKMAVKKKIKFILFLM